MKQRASVIMGILMLLTMSMIAQIPPLYAIPPDRDIDGDGIPDVQEDVNGNSIVDPGETDPYNADTDRGGESDGSEVRAGRNPLEKNDDFTADPDGDGWSNGIEFLHGTDPKSPDTDGDGIIDSKDPFPLDAKYSLDADRNGLPDVWEQETHLNQQTIPQSKVDDPDQDGLSNIEELARGTNPVTMDTDRDGINDKDEIDHGSNPSESPCLQYRQTDDHFPDLSDHWSAPYVSTLRGISILPKKITLVVGYLPPSGNPARALFAPNRLVTRFEFLKMVMLSTCTRLINTTETEHDFSDVINIAAIDESADQSLRRTVIYTAKHYDIVAGYDDGTFQPDAPVNRAEAVKMLLLAAQIPPLVSSGSLTFSDVSPTDWFDPYIRLASGREIVRGYQDGTFRPTASITRGEAAKIVEVVMRQNPLVNGYVLP